MAMLNGGYAGEGGRNGGLYMELCGLLSTLGSPVLVSAALLLFTLQSTGQLLMSVVQNGSNQNVPKCVSSPEQSTTMDCHYGLNVKCHHRLTFEHLAPNGQVMF